METMLLRLFQKQILLQCKFILVASNELNTSLITGDITRTFYAIQNLLVAASNVSKALWGQARRKSEERKPLRESIGIEDDSPLSRILTRDDFEHFDERLTRWWAQSENHNYLDLSLGPLRTSVQGLSEQDMFRGFNPQTSDVMFWGTDFNLNSLIQEVLRILPILEREANKPHWDEQASSS
jgi:hypothetical protein